MQLRHTEGLSEHLEHLKSDIIWCNIKTARRGGNLPDHGPQPLKEATVDIKRIPPVGDPFTAAPHHDHQDERPHACNDGWVTIGQIAVDVDTGEEVEEFALYLCRRCAKGK
jgi:hypothetical protein